MFCPSCKEELKHVGQNFGCGPIFWCDNCKAKITIRFERVTEFYDKEEDEEIETNNCVVNTQTISEKQRCVIRMIESNLNIKFTGKTSEEARKFTSENIELSKRARADHWNKVNASEREEDYDPREDFTDEDSWEDYADKLAFDPNFS